jgi:hypothetical protein
MQSRELDILGIWVLLRSSLFVIMLCTHLTPKPTGCLIACMNHSDINVAVNSKAWGLQLVLHSAAASGLFCAEAVVASAAFHLHRQ